MLPHLLCEYHPHVADCEPASSPRQPSRVLESSERLVEQFHGPVKIGTVVETLQDAEALAALRHDEQLHIVELLRGGDLRDGAHTVRTRGLADLHPLPYQYHPETPIALQAGSDHV